MVPLEHLPSVVSFEKMTKPNSGVNS
jgi:hypothetical protein